MGQTITPDKQSVENCLNNKTYYVDFYQREYVWGQETAKTLLDDIFYVFELSYSEYKNSELNPAIIEKYNWYYLNVYITNRIDGKKYIVDGQQRLTTLTLIATKLYHLLDETIGIERNIKELLRPCIFRNDGFEYIYNLDHCKRRRVMDYLFKDNFIPIDLLYHNKTEQNLVERYKDISKYLDEKLLGSVRDSHKISSFVFYFLKRLVLVELEISETDTPMVFEVINDRGEELKPFEILKGKMIGSLSKDDTDDYCQKWDNAIRPLDKEEDMFFSDLLKARFIFKNNSELEKKLNKQYHRYIFENNEIALKLGFQKTNEKHIQNIKTFISQDIVYYSKLYKKLLSANENNPYLTYLKKINSLSGHYQNIISACFINDPQEDEKIMLISKECDRLWVLLNLNGIYDSNDFQNITFQLNELLKGATIDQYKNIFDNILRVTISEKYRIDSDVSLLEYAHFIARTYSTLNIRFIRYLFARVEKYLCENIKQEPQNPVEYISTRTGDKTAYHIEHILSRNETNLNYFESEEEFDKQRNLLGGLLLLKDRANLSSKNEEYIDKLKTYSASLVWGHTLCEDFYHSTNKDFLDFNERVFKDKPISFKPYSVFDNRALEERTRLLYEIVKIIWEVDR